MADQVVNEILDAFAEVDAAAEAQDTADLAGMLESTLRVSETIKTKLRNSLSRDSLLKAVEKTIKERQKALLSSLKSGSLTNKKMSDLLEAFRQLDCKIMQHHGA